MHMYVHTHTHTYTHTHAHIHTHAHAVEWSDEEGPPEEEDEVTDDELPTGKIGTKKLRRIQAKAERKAQREVG